jgi:hypothetical protein
MDIIPKKRPRVDKLLDSSLGKQRAVDYKKIDRYLEIIARVSELGPEFTKLEYCAQRIVRKACEEIVLEINKHHSFELEIAEAEILDNVGILPGK